MHCKHCGKEVKPEVVACLNCGMDPNKDNKYCHSCGVETKSDQVVCIKCGVGLSGSVSPSSSGVEGFYRSSDEKIIAGVCSGLAHKFGMSVVLMRVIFVILGLWGFGLLAYIIGLFFPKRPTTV